MTEIVALVVSIIALAFAVLSLAVARVAALRTRRRRLQPADWAEAHRPPGPARPNPGIVEQQRRRLP